MFLLCLINCLVRLIFVLVQAGMPNHGCSGCKCTPCLLHFQLCGCSVGADYGCNRCTKLLQQTELNVARGCVWGCSTPQSSGIRQSCYHLAKGETESITNGIFGEKLRRNCA
jgi:hypothetical protein